jgi:uncharacterized protein YjbI with pentapeptide repeats
VQIKDLGNYEFKFVIHPDLNPASLVGDRSDGNIVLNASFAAGAGDLFQVLFRFFPDGTQIGDLNEGEVAIYQQCNFQGKAAVFIPLLGAGKLSPAYSLTALTTAATTLDATAKSFRIGKGASLYWGPDSKNIQAVAVSDVMCSETSPTGQFFVEPLVDTLNTFHDRLSKGCVNCSFGGQTLDPAAGSADANFSGWNFSGADFSNSVLTNLNMSDANMSGAKFVGATLTDVNLSGIQVSGTSLDFSGATLTHVNFDGVDISTFKFVGATFCGVTLTGSDAFHLLDLTTGNFANAHVVLDSSCATNLSYTRLTPAPVTGNQWKGLNLTGTVVLGLQGRVLSTQANPLNLTGAILTGSSLQGAMLDYAQGLAGQDLTGIRLNNASLRHVNLSAAKLYGAKFNNANLEGANMNSVFLTKIPSTAGGAADLQGAFLRDVNLSQAKLSGANFTNANFYSQAAVGPTECTPDPHTGFTTGCATAAGATMDEAAFNNAYLFGVDFTNATAQGVNFGNAFLVGANFSGASLTASVSGLDTGFSGAFLQGTNMAGLTLENGVSLQNAFVDFTPTGNVLNLVLNGQHTTFADYWSTPGEPVCAQMAYNGPTTAPATNQQIICPDGNQYPNGCGVTAINGSNLHWESPVDITTEASYLNNATYTNAPASGNPICAADLKWVPLSFAEPIPPRPHQKRH